MENREKPELIFWFDAPPRAGAGVFRHVANHWGKPVFFICATPLREERKSGGWQECDHGEAIVVILSEEEDADKFLSGFLKEHPFAIHVCNGFRSQTTAFLKKHVFSNSEAQIAVWSERPNLYGTKTKLFLLRLLHSFLAVLFARKVKVYLALGTIGVREFACYGWSRDKLFPFMYDPLIVETPPFSQPRLPEAPLRFLYLGRFARETKGLDVLIDAIDQLKGDNWQLDLVGGYGDMKDLAISWAEKHPRVSFLGKWASKEVPKRISQYDVCLVPSRYDGWNVITNEALRAGVGVIITDAAASDDLIRASGAGTVVPAGNIDALRAAIQGVIDNPAIAETWKERARAYSPRISSETVGRYLMDILEYTFIDPTKPRPECPWL